VAGAAAAIVAGGIVYAAALPPYGWSGLAWVALVPLLVVAQRCTPRRAYLAGALYGFAFFAFSAPWLVGAVHAYFASSLVFAVLFCTGAGLLYIAVYVGFVGLGARYLLARGHWTALVGIPALWVVHELARTRVLTGLPWNLLAHSQWSTPALIQISDVTGAYGVSFLVAMVNVAIVLAEREWRTGAVRRALAPLAVAVVVVVAAGAYGQTRLASVGGTPAGAGARTVAIVQGNAPLVTTWQRAASDRALLLYSDLTRRVLAEHSDLVVWPEYALPLYPEGDPSVLPLLTSLASETSAGLVFGAPRMVVESGREHYRNAAYHLAPDGGLAAYDKRHLVPFAEYHPLAFGPAVAAAGEREFSAGDHPTPFATSSGRLGMLICYEVIYPELVNELVRAGAEVLVNVSNDGWLDLAELGAAEQHLAIAVFRAVETRRYLARAASTGISGFIDPTGRPFALLGTGTRGVTSGAIVPRDDVTLYVRSHDAFAFACLVLALALVGRAARRQWT
jgi:apolipoprotein N-acyltransferase